MYTQQIPPPLTMWQKALGAVFFVILIGIALYLVFPDSDWERVGQAVQGFLNGTP